jgi:hypothetical protein
MAVGRPPKPLFTTAKPLPPMDAASEGAVSIEYACSHYLGGIGRTKFYELVDDGEIELVHEGTRAVVPVKQLVDRLARKIQEEREDRQKRELLGT